MLIVLVVGTLALAFNVQPTTSLGGPTGFVVRMEPEHPTVRDDVNVTVVFLDVPSVSYAFGFGPLIRVSNEFSVEINVSIPLISLPAYVGNVTHTYDLGRLLEGSYNFSATVHYWQQLPDETWPAWPFDYFYRESFDVGIRGDINGDGTVDIYDAVELAASFGYGPGDPEYNPNADINGDGTVDIYDAVLLATHYGQHYP